MSSCERHSPTLAARLLCSTLLVLLGCEAIADLDGLRIVEDAGTDLDAGSGHEPNPFDGGADPFPELRDLCVETINAQRSTLSLPPLARASALQQSCADEGARVDAELNSPHYAAQHRSESCARLGFGPQNSCPNWRYGAGTGNASERDALVRCIQQMWAEGMPPIPESECRADLSAGGCFAQHGHWINLASTRSKVVACGFALLPDGGIWINQDFAAR